MENVKMDAIEFIKERERMCHYQCNTDGRYGCSDCVIQEFRPFISGINRLEQCEKFESEMPELFVTLVKQWSDEHPVMTNADKFIKVFGDIDLLTDGVDIRRPCSWWREEYKGTDDTAKFQNDEQADNENPMEKITEEAMELLCNKYCKFSDTVKDQEELEQICDKCRVGKLIGIDAVNEYNRMKEVGADETD